MENPRLMGLDLSVNGTGVCLPDGSTMRVNGKASEGDYRLPKIRDHIRMAVRTSHARLVVIEGMGGHYPGRTQGVLGEVHGMVKTELLDQGVPYVLVPQSSLKLFATGRGNADKAAMAKAARDHADVLFGNDDECDAWWLWRAGIDRYADGGEFSPLPSTQRHALDVVTWPPVSVPAGSPAGPETAVQRAERIHGVKIQVDGCPACHGHGSVHFH